MRHEEGRFFVILHIGGASSSKKGGKKLVRGVKTFDLENMDSQLSFAQKISKKSLELAEIAFFESW